MYGIFSFVSYLHGTKHKSKPIWITWATVTQQIFLENSNDITNEWLNFRLEVIAISYSTDGCNWEPKHLFGQVKLTLSLPQLPEEL
jgi:hypothetical protein